MSYVSEKEEKERKIEFFVIFEMVENFRKSGKKGYVVR